MSWTFLEGSLYLMMFIFTLHIFHHKRFHLGSKEINKNKNHNKVLVKPSSSYSESGKALLSHIKGTVCVISRNFKARPIHNSTLTILTDQWSGMWDRWSVKGLKVTIENLALPSLHEGHFKLRLQSLYNKNNVSKK